MPRHRVTALVSGDVSPLDLGAVAEVFGVDPGLAPDWYEFSICGSAPGPNTMQGGLHLIIDRGLEALAEADTIVVLPFFPFAGERAGECMLGLLADAAARGCRILSVRVAAFVLAAAGLLDHRRATTHWQFCAALAAAYPLVQVVPDAPYVDEGNILTSGGAGAVIDLCLHVVRKDHGAEVADRLARLLVTDPHRDGAQAHFLGRPAPDADGRRLGPTLAWALSHLAERPDPDRLAAMAAMSRRTLYREFRAETGTTPHRWLVAQQVGLAQRMLETSRFSVAEVARRCGFDDVSVFRRHFTAKTGLSPVAYRRAFGQFGAGTDILKRTDDAQIAG